MAVGGLTLAELQNGLAGPARVRITASTGAGQWICARWSCGCCAEGTRMTDLVLLERCSGHRVVFVQASP